MRKINIKDLPVVISIETFLEDCKKRNMIIDYKFDKIKKGKIYYNIDRILPGEIHQITIEGKING